MEENTIFDRILNGEIPCEEIYKDEKCLAFKDVEPQAPVHILIIPRKRIKSLNEAERIDIELLGHLLFVTKKVANLAGIKEWRTIINTGEKAGQTIFHLHLHIIGGRALKWPPG